MEGIRLPSPVPPAHLRNERNEKSYQTNSVQRSQNDVRNNPHRSPGAGRRSRSSQKPTTSPKVGNSQSHSQGIGGSRSTSPPTRITVVNTRRTRSPQPIRQLTLQDVDRAQPPEVIIPLVIAPNSNQTVSATAVDRNDSHCPDSSSGVGEIQRSEEYVHYHRSRSQQRTRSPDPESDRSPGSRQGVVHRFTTRISPQPHGRRTRTPTPVILDPSIYARVDNKPPSEPPSSECPTGDEAVTANGPRQTVQSDSEDRANKEDPVTVALAHRRPDQFRLVKDRDRRIGQLKDELAAAHRELENERQQRMRLELQVQSQQRETHSRMIQTEGQDDWEVVGYTPTTVAHCQRDFRSVKWEKQDLWRKETDTKWNELQNDMKKVQEVLVEVRQRVLKINVETESKPLMENAIEEIRKESAEQLELLSSLTESLRADSARRQDENNKSQERAPLDAQSYIENYSRPLASEVLMLLNEVSKLHEERRSLQHELGSLLCLKAKYSPGGEFDPEWTPPPSGPPTALSSPPELPVPLEIPQQTKLTWRTVYPKLGRIKKKEMLPVTTTPNPRK